MSRRRLVTAGLLLALAGPLSWPDRASAQASRRAGAARQGWSAADLREFYHGSLGGEIFPISWARALESASTRRPFLEGLDRFGFLDDPQDPDHLPIGLTATAAKNPKLARMMGINCAACHVGEMFINGSRHRIDGAPNVLMDFVALNADLTRSVKRVAEEPGDFAAFQFRLVGSPEEAARLGAIEPEVLKRLKALADYDRKDGSHQMVDALSAALTPMFQPKQSSWPCVGNIMAMPPIDQPVALEFAAPLEVIGEEAGPAIAAFLSANSGKGAPMGVLASDPITAIAELEGLTRKFVEHFIKTIWYLKQASAFMTRGDMLRNMPGGTTAGPGRLDDFALAGNLVLGNLLLAKAAVSPTSYPTLWGTDRVKWLGWDGNTNSTMQRNIATSIALGGVLDLDTGTSSIPMAGVYRLEVLASKVNTPRWPLRIDPARVDRGESIFRNLCARCHVDPDAVAPAPGGTLPDWLPDLLYDPAGAPGGPETNVGTDPNRALAFVQYMKPPMPGMPNLPDGLTLLQKILYAKAKIGTWEARRLQGDRDETWRPTGKYAGRPLIGVWAAAPYLHNDSVPKLYDLLQPASKRPVQFRRGGRRFDPVKVGYQEPGPGEPAFEFDTALPGNRNVGHEYGTQLTDPERLDLIEYLKTR